MVEAAFIIPILILMIAGLLMLSVFCYEYHCRQISCHEELLGKWDENRKAYSVERDQVFVRKGLEGLSDAVLERNTSHRVYQLRPAQWINLEEMVMSDEK